MDTSYTVKTILHLDIRLPSKMSKKYGRHEKDSNKKTSTKHNVKNRMVKINV